MYSRQRKYAQFGTVIAIIVLGLGYLAYTGVQESKSYYVTLKELNTMGDSAYSKRLRVAGNVEAGSIRRQGTHVEFALREEGRLLPVVYNGTEAPPDTFKDDSQALAEGTYGRDGVFHANKLQAKCASKYAPKPGDSAQTPAEKAQAAGAASQPQVAQTQPSSAPRSANQTSTPVHQAQTAQAQAASAKLSQ